MGFTDMRRLPALILALALGAGPLPAHEFWIAPVDFTLAPDQPLVAELRVGQDFAGETFPYLPPRFIRFDLVAGNEVLPLPGRIGDDPALNVSELPEGLLVLAYVSTPSLVTYEDAETYDLYLAQEGLEFAAGRNAARGIEPVGMTERFTRHAKSLIAVGNATGRDRLLGLKVEIVAGANPYVDDVAAGLPMQLFRNGASFPDTLLRVFTRSPNGTVREDRLTTDSEGRAVVPTVSGATILVSAVTLDEEEGEARWHSHWASLSFAVPE